MNNSTSEKCALPGSNNSFAEKYDVRISLQPVAPFFLAVFSIVLLSGGIGNILMIYSICKDHLYKNPTYIFLMNIAVAGLLKLLIVLPLTLTNLILSCYLLGSFLCYVLPMMQHLTIHSGMLTFVLLSIDRYRLIAYPMKPRLPAALCALVVWIISICVVLPFSMYMKYLHGLNPESAIGYCLLEQTIEVKEFVRGSFVALYCCPLALQAFLIVRISMELKTAMELSNFSMNEVADGPPSEDDTQEVNNLDNNEKRNQKYLSLMMVIYGISWLPTNTIILVQHLGIENTTNEQHMEKTYLTFTLFGYISCISTPVLFFWWRMESRTRSRLRHYLRFSSARQLVINESHSSVTNLRSQD